MTDGEPTGEHSEDQIRNNLHAIKTKADELLGGEDDYKNFELNTPEGKKSLRVNLNKDRKIDLGSKKGILRRRINTESITVLEISIINSAPDPQNPLDMGADFESLIIISSNSGESWQFINKRKAGDGANGTPSLFDHILKRGETIESRKVLDGDDLNPFRAQAQDIEKFKEKIKTVNLNDEIKPQNPPKKMPPPIF